MWSFSVNIFVFLLCLSAISMGHGADEMDEDELDLSVFEHQEFFKRVENKLKSMNAQSSRSLLSKLGKIALYFRLYRTSISSPSTGHQGFDSFFPQPPVQFHQELFRACSSYNFDVCVNAIFASIQLRAKFMFPLKDQKTTDSLPLDVYDFAHRVSNSKFSFDMSVAYLFCFFTKRRLIVLERLPFCSYGIESHQIKLWPAGPFRQYNDSPEISSQLDPIDTFLNQREFECADVSFCPDPCCGRKSLRFLRRDVIFSPTGGANISGFCGHSACAMNVKHLDERMATEHFKKKEKKGRKTKGEENDGDAVTTETEGSTRQKDANNSLEHGDNLENSFNDDFGAIMQNRWNLSCACASGDGRIDNSKIYRFDVLQCVDLDECLYEECPSEQRCLNINEGKMCACSIGFHESRTGCRKFTFSSESKISNVLKDVLATND